MTSIQLPPVPDPSTAPVPERGGRTTYYKDHQGDLPRRLREALPADELKRLSRRSGWEHAVVAVRHIAIHLTLAIGLLVFENPLIWVPLAALQGVNILGFIILLHDVIHGVVFPRRRPLMTRLLGLLYAAPSAIAASQFERWHMDHHRGLGSATEDPKRHHLSPKKNSRFVKLLYVTPVLFAIYAKAAGTEVRSYEPALRRRINLERLGNVLVHAGFVTLLALNFGGDAVLRVWAVPLFGFFPLAFMVNRLGQHYWIDPSDPAKWGTRVDGSPLTRFLFVNSNFHLEHHYFPSVPLQNLVALNRSLRPFWDGIGHPSRAYFKLLWKWFIENREAHTEWSSSTP
jgi:fatty acid desaturase